MSKEAIMVHRNGIHVPVEIVNVFGESIKCTVMWVRELEKGYVEASLKYADGGFNIFLCKVLDNGKLQPHSCLSQIEEGEFGKVKLFRKLNASNSTIVDRLIEDRIRKDKEDDTNKS